MDETMNVVGSTTGKRMLLPWSKWSHRTWRDLRVGGNVRIPVAGSPYLKGQSGKSQKHFEFEGNLIDHVPNTEVLQLTEDRTLEDLGQARVLDREDGRERLDLGGRRVLVLEPCGDLLQERPDDRWKRDFGNLLLLHEQTDELRPERDDLRVVDGGGGTVGEGRSPGGIGEG